MPFQTSSDHLMRYFTELTFVNYPVLISSFSIILYTRHSLHCMKRLIDARNLTIFPHDLQISGGLWIRSRYINLPKIAVKSFLSYFFVKKYLLVSASGQWVSQ